MNTCEPVRKSGRGRRANRLTAVASAGALAVLGTALPAAASPAAHQPAPQVSLRLAAPSPRAAVADTTELDFTGRNLAAVRVYRLARLVATATVSADGTAAVAQVDTARFADGPLGLTALAWGRTGRLGAAAPVLLRVDNRHADRHPAGYRLAFTDEFSGRTLDRDEWCTRYMYDGGTESAAEQAKIPADCLGEDPATHKTLGTLDTLGGDGTAPGQEAEVYRDVNGLGQPTHTLQNGYLALHATATRLDQPYLKYESAMIRSQREYQPTQGHPLYLTARVKMPDVLGTWPAFWLAGGYGDGHVRPPWPPEIDILEGPLNNSGQFANVYHTGVQTYGCDGPCPQGPTFDYSDVNPNFDPQWGDYHDPDGSLKDKWVEVGLQWWTDHACWYFNGTKLACQHYIWVANEGPADTNPAAILLNLGVGGPWAGADGVADAEFPTEYDIDHVRVYRK
jgi:Glycosyl hydrolases family 16